MQFRKLFTLLSFTALVCSASSVAVPKEDAATRGIEIGTVIASAIDTALPGISKLTSSIVEIFKPKDSIKAEKQKAVETAVAAATNDLAVSLKKALIKVEPLATQLDALGPFLQYGFRADNELAGLIAIVALNPNPTPAQWSSAIAPKWAKVKGALDQIPSDASDVRAKVKSEQLQALLLQILEAKAVTVKGIDSLVSTKTASGLPSELAQLDSTLSTLHVLARIQMNGVSDQVHGLVNWAAGIKEPQGEVHSLPMSIQTDVAAAGEILKTASGARKPL